MLDPLISTIEVLCDQEKAFSVFVNEMGSWWPLEKRSMSMHDGKSAKSLHIESKLGGRIVETGHDDTKHHWGTIKSYDPFDSIAMDEKEVARTLDIDRVGNASFKTFVGDQDRVGV